MYVKLTGALTYGRISRTVDNKRLEYCRRAVLLSGERLAMFTRHEDTKWSSVH